MAKTFKRFASISVPFDQFSVSFVVHTPLSTRTAVERHGRLLFVRLVSNSPGAFSCCYKSFDVYKHISYYRYDREEVICPYHMLYGVSPLLANRIAACTTQRGHNRSGDALIIPPVENIPVVEVLIVLCIYRLCKA